MRRRTLEAHAALLLVGTAVGLAGCGSDSPTEPEPPEPTVVEVLVQSAVDASALEGANVVLYDAGSREAVERGLTNSEGRIWFERSTGDYYLNVSAQGFRPRPPENITPIPFFVAPEDTTSQTVNLLVLDDIGGAGYVLGWVDPPTSNFLITAESQSTQEHYFTACGPDGVFILFNLPYADYSIEAWQAGYAMGSSVNASIGAGAEVDSVLVEVAEYSGSSLDGSITFLASENSVVDITLLHPETRAVIPGLSVENAASNLTYLIDRIPDGDYLAWASLENDGYVLDPDWLFKNPGGLDVSFLSASSDELNFSVTDAIILNSPTNPAENTRPAIVNTTTPTFEWAAYPSTQEYIIEIRNLDGDRLWGGFESDGTVNHAYIAPNNRSVEYNFDAQPGVPALEPGEIYQWRLWADKGTAADGFVEQLISASEDLRGLFQLGLE